MVEAWIDYEPSRGAKHIEGDTWVSMDASFKQYTYTEGMNVDENVPFDAQGFTDQIEASAPVTGGVLVTDMNEQRIWRVHDDLSYEAYGKGEIESTLQRLASQKDRWSLLRMATMFLVLVGGSMVLITVIVHSVSRRKRLLTP